MTQEREQISIDCQEGYHAKCISSHCYCPCHIEPVGGKSSGEATKPKIVCLCGSTRFTPLMMAFEWEYAKQGILALGWFVKPIKEGEQDHHLAEKDGCKEIFDELHKRKIDLADEVLILNVGGYIGESTKREIAYAKAHSKPIYYLEAENV